MRRVKDSPREKKSWEREREREPASAEGAERACDKFVGYRAERAWEKYVGYRLLLLLLSYFYYVTRHCSFVNIKRKN